MAARRAQGRAVPPKCSRISAPPLAGSAGRFARSLTPPARLDRRRRLSQHPGDDQCRSISTSRNCAPNCGTPSTPISGDGSSRSLPWRWPSARPSGPNRKVLPASSRPSRGGFSPCSPARAMPLRRRRFIRPGSRAAASCARGAQTRRRPRAGGRRSQSSTGRWYRSGPNCA